MISIVALLLTPLITTHEPSSRDVTTVDDSDCHEIAHAPAFGTCCRNIAMLMYAREALVETCSAQ